MTMQIQVIIEKFTTEIIVAVISVIVAAIADWIKRHPPNIIMSRETWTKLAAITMVICLFSLVFVSIIVILDVVGPKESVVRITYPSDGATVEIREIVRGTSQNIPKEQAIWVVIYPHEVNRYYPQDYPADIQANGYWSSLAFFGSEKDTGKKFDVVVVLANKDAQDTFNAYLKKGKEEKSWPGLERLPEGAVIYDRITVTRK